MWRILLGEFLGDLQAQRTRALLTFFAVAWGTLSVVLLLAFGEGLKRAVTGGLLAAGDRIFMVGGGETSRTWQGLPQGRRIALVEEDLELLRSSIPDLDRAAPSYGRYGVSFQVDSTRTNAYTEGATIFIQALESIKGIRRQRSPCASHRRRQSGSETRSGTKIKR